MAMSGESELQVKGYKLQVNCRTGTTCNF